MTDRLSTTRCFPFLAVKHAPSYRQRKRSLDSARDNDTGNVLFPHILCMMHGIAIPPRCHFERSEKSFSSPFSLTSSLSRLREAPSTFPRYGVSRSSLSNTLRLTTNEKDPSTSLGMTIRETRLFHFPRYGVSRFSPSDTLRLTANEKDPSTPLPMTIREERVSHTFFV